ncbi:MAG: hypothetical protein ACI9BV_003344 [Rhodothermales bacterium]
MTGGVPTVSSQGEDSKRGDREGLYGGLSGRAFLPRIESFAGIVADALDLEKPAGGSELSRRETSARWGHLLQDHIGIS